jgi:phage terminase large subunit
MRKRLMKLNLKQTKALDYLEDNTTTELLYGGGAGGGKSILGCYWQLKRRLKFPGTRGLIGRANLKTLKETTLQSFFEVCRLQGLKADTHFRYNQQTGSISFPNGSQILLKDLFLYPSDPNFDELGSLEITDAFVDEANQITEKAWNIVKSRIRYRLDENGLNPKMLGSCNPAKSWIYTRFYKPSKESILQADRKFIQALVGDNPDVSKHYRENLLGLDEASKQRLLYGNWEWDDDLATLIPYDKIIDCFSNDFDNLGGDGFITCDVARFGSDNTVLGLWSGYRVKLWSHHGLSVTDTADKVRELQRLGSVPNSNIIVDEDGVGGGVVDILGCKGFVNNSRALNDENFANLKSQCYFKLAEKINKGEVYIDCKDVAIKEMIIQELEQVKQHNMDKDGKKAVVPKDRVKELIGRSPDFSDTLMMRMYFELQPAVEFAFW